MAVFEIELRQELLGLLKLSRSIGERFGGGGERMAELGESAIDLSGVCQPPAENIAAQIARLLFDAE